MPQKPDPIELLYAYSNGYFPMAHPEDNNLIYWHRPELRGILPLEDFRASKNLLRLYKSKSFTYTINQDFEAVIRGCANRDSTWISDEIIAVYCQLNKMNCAFSVEVWKDDALVGGLYGVSLKSAYFGESMFSRVSNASKLALVHLVNHLKKHNYSLLDTQYLNDHLKQFGAVEIPDEKYIELLEDALSD